MNIGESEGEEVLHYWLRRDRWRWIASESIGALGPLRLRQGDLFHSLPNDGHGANSRKCAVYHYLQSSDIHSSEGAYVGLLFCCFWGFKTAEGNTEYRFEQRLLCVQLDTMLPCGSFL